MKSITITMSQEAFHAVTIALYELTEKLTSEYNSLAPEIENIRDAFEVVEEA